MIPTQMLILLLFTSSVIGCFLAFKLVDSLRIVAAKNHEALLKQYSVIMASGIFILHAGYQFTADNIPKITQHPVDFIGSLLCAYLLSISILKTVNKRRLGLSELMYASLGTGVSGYLLSYFFHISAGAINIRIDTWTALFALFLTCLTSALAIVTILWLKGYEGCRHQHA